MSGPVIIGLAGLKFAGKDSVGEILQRYSFINVKYAGALKAMLETLLIYNGIPKGIVSDIIEGSLKEVSLPELEGRSFRHAAQTLGTEWGRDLIGEQLWVNSFYRQASQHPFVVCTDVRFSNEVSFIQSKGGVVWRVEREGQGVGTDMHPSETEIMNLKVDAIISNARSDNWKLVLEEQTNFLLDEFMKGRT